MNNPRKFDSIVKRYFWHILLWSIAVLYLVFSPSFFYQFFVQDGKPLEVWEQQPEESGGIRYNIEDLKYWAENIEIHEEGETYALWGWAFLDIGQKVEQENFDRFILLSDHADSYVFPVQVYPRQGVHDAFKNLDLGDLTSSGFYAVIAKNALPYGTYSVGLLLTREHNEEQYYIKTNKELLRTPNHLKLETQP